MSKCVEWKGWSNMNHKSSFDRQCSVNLYDSMAGKLIR